MSDAHDAMRKASRRADGVRKAGDARRALARFASKQKVPNGGPVPGIVPKNAKGKGK
jgi:hypothetical protein